MIPAALATIEWLMGQGRSDRVELSIRIIMHVYFVAILLWRYCCGRKGRVRGRRGRREIDLKGGRAKGR